MQVQPVLSKAYASVTLRHTRHLFPLYLKETPILSHGYNFDLTKELLIFLALRKETIAYGDKYAFLSHVYVKYHDTAPQYFWFVHWFCKFERSNTVLIPFLKNFRGQTWTKSHKFI